MKSSNSKKYLADLKMQTTILKIKRVEKSGFDDAKMLYFMISSVGKVFTTRMVFNNSYI